MSAKAFRAKKSSCPLSFLSHANPSPPYYEPRPSYYNEKASFHPILLYISPTNLPFLDKTQAN